MCREYSHTASEEGEISGFLGSSCTPQEGDSKSSSPNPCSNNRATGARGGLASLRGRVFALGTALTLLFNGFSSKLSFAE